MARYKHYSYEQSKLLPIRFSEQILPGTFEYTLNTLIEEIDLSAFDARYKNDDTGAPAYDPRVLLKIILFAYSRGVIYSRRIEQLCRENVVMMALSADAQPDFTTIADFVSSSSEQIVPLFRQVLLVCDAMGLIGRELFAIDGCKLSSNAAKEWSGTKADLKKKHAKLTRAITVMLERHRQADAAEATGEIAARERQYIETLRSRAAKIEAFLATHAENVGPKGTIRQSNITDPDSAKMKTAHGVLQGYNGVTAVDAKHQVIVHAQAFGEGQEHHLLQPMIEACRAQAQALGDEEDVFKTAKLTADAGFHTEANMEYVFRQGIDATIADKHFRKRDPRFASAGRHKERAHQDRRPSRLFRPDDFLYDQARRTCVCPAGQRLYKNGERVAIRGLEGVKFKAPKSACRPCALRARCLRHPEKTAARQVVFFTGRGASGTERFTEKMKRKIDSAVGRLIYQRRLATAEPPFANIRHAKGLDRFTLRGKTKVNGQWLLYCLIHNIGKLQRYGPAPAPSG